MKRIGLVVLGLLLMGVCQPASTAAELTMADILSGKSVPLNITYKEVTEEWKQFNLASASDNLPRTQYMAMMAARYGITGASAKPVYFTKGQTVQCGSESYLLAYTIEEKEVDFTTMARMMNRGDMMENMPPDVLSVDPLTPDTQLNLCLLNLKRTGNLLNIRKFDMEKELKEQNDKRKKLAQQISVNYLQQLCQQLRQFSEQNDNKLPDLHEANNLYQQYLDRGTMMQPGTEKPYLPNSGLSGMSLKDVPDPENTPGLYEAVPSYDGSRCVGFLDGHAKIVTKAEWEVLKKKWALP